MTEIQIVALCVAIFGGLCCAAMIVAHAILRLEDRLGAVNVKWVDPTVYLKVADTPHQT